ncbi:NAD(P)/FAD-dependent oxidoreductase [Mycobacteroides abscessus subsp. abscessus]|uniref:flavin-containing monooxygenase n=1 Tax=Mycobacteroides abscessus TaxID=36809 RepID=UPI003CF7F6C7
MTIRSIMSDMPRDELVDVLIVGAGISGINAAIRLSGAGRSFHIVERRERIGGTWDLFRYPGIRSDSDIYTLSFGYHPWHERNTIADGADIRDYLEHAASDYDIDGHITFSAKVTSADFGTDTDIWSVRVDTPAGPTTYRAKFLYLCTGYYNYDDGYTPEFPGVEKFAGRLIHPQHWPDDLDCSGKEITVIGSGATAITLVPSLARAGAKVNMLQRSPSYIYPIARVDAVVDVMRKVFPLSIVQHFARIWLGGFNWIMYQVCRKAPGFAKWFLRRRITKLLPAGYPVDVHFAPRYNPWDQRVCADTDGDLFEAISNGGVRMVTDTIDTFTSAGIRLGSGQELPADVIITATGLNLQIFGGIALSVDGSPVDAPNRFIYKGYLIEGVPNAAWSVGYTNASWTLRADLSARAVVRLLDYMDRHGYTHAYPDRHGEELEARPFFNLSSGYVTRGDAHMPRSGISGPWAIRHNYVLDFLAFHRDRIDENMQFGIAKSKAVSSAA